jgi:hypothetical protein
MAQPGRFSPLGQLQNNGDGCFTAVLHVLLLTVSLVPEIIHQQETPTTHISGLSTSAKWPGANHSASTWLLLASFSTHKPERGYDICW